jgi:c(7)-type cytochrome triheme protein
MKIHKKIIWMFGVVACVGLLCSAGRMANAADNEYDEDTYGPKELIVWQTPVPRVTFSHKVHTMDAELQCDACHDDLFQMEAGSANGNNDFNMKSFAEGKYCGACHDGKTAFSASDEAACVSCHNPPKSIVFTKPVKAVIFDHPKHVDMGMGCSACHDKLFTMRIGAAEEKEADFVMESLYKGKYCGGCHNGDDAFASNTRCTTCHIGVMGHSRLFGKPQTSEHGGGEHH